MKRRCQCRVPVVHEVRSYGDFVFWKARNFQNPTAGGMHVRVTDVAAEHGVRSYDLAARLDVGASEFICPLAYPELF